MEFDFSTGEVVEDVNAVPENFRGAYAQGEDGKWKIGDNFKPFAEAVTGLNKALKAERAAHATVKGQKDVKTLVKEVLGFDDLESAKAKIEELSQAVAAKANVDPAKIRKEIEDTFSAERVQLTDAKTKMQRRLETHLIGKTAATEIAAAKGNATLLLPHVERQCKVIEEGDEYVVRVVDADGQYRGDGKGGFMGVTDLVAEMKANKSFAGAFESETTNGKTQVQQPRPGPVTVKVATAPNAGDKTPVDKIAAGLAAIRNGK